MKINDKKELHTKSASELKKMLKDGHELLQTLKLDREQNKLKNTRSLFTTRKTIAIIKTILNGKEESEALPKGETAKEEKVANVKEATKEKKAVKAAPSTK